MFRKKTAPKCRAFSGQPFPARLVLAVGMVYHWLAVLQLVQPQLKFPHLQGHGEDIPLDDVAGGFIQVGKLVVGLDSLRHGLDAQLFRHPHEALHNGL